MEMVYISHPYTGDEKANREDAERIRRKLQRENPGTCYVMPIGMFGTENAGYCRILSCCLELEKRCDAVIFCPGWEDSSGCKAEMAFALQRGMDIDFLKPYREGGGDE